MISIMLLKNCWYKMVLKNIKHIWWDLDDTLYAPVQGYSNAKLKVLVKEYARLAKISLSEAKKRYKKDYEKFGSMSNLFIARFGLSRIYGQKIINNVDRKKYIKHSPKVVDFFKEFKKKFPKIKHSVLSNSEKKQVLLTLDLIGLDRKLFTFIKSTIEMGAPKPYVECYKSLIKISKAPAKQIVYVGDREKADVIPAKKAGLKVILINKNAKKSKADFVVKEISKILRLFK